MKLKNKSIVILSYMRFDGLASTNFTIAKYLSKENKVYYVDHPYTWLDYMRADKESQSFRVRKKLFTSCTTHKVDQHNDNLQIIIPFPVLPINWLPEGKIYRYGCKLNEALVAKKIRKILRDEGVDEYIYINSWNFHYPGLSRYLKPSLSVYHCVDPLVTRYDKKHGVLSENALVKESDLVICSSKSLQLNKRSLNKNTYFVPNAADLVLRSDGGFIHQSLKKIPSPIIGYIGALERRVDFDLLEDLIRMNSDMSFVFVGPVSKDVVPKWLYERENVYLLPPVQYGEIISCMNGFDVCLIPFKKDAVSNTIFPLKLFEYLGVGKPVVSTDFNLDLKEFTGDTVSYIANARQCSEAIKWALIHGGEGREQRLAIAKQNTWQVRVDVLAAIIYDGLEKKN